MNKLTGIVINVEKRLDCTLIDLLVNGQAKRCIVFFDIQAPKLNKTITVEGNNESNAFYVDSVCFNYNLEII